MEAFNLPFRPGAGSSKEQKKTSDFFTKSKGKGKGATNGAQAGEEGEVRTTGSKRKRPVEGDGEVINVDQVEDQDDDFQVLPTPPKRSEPPTDASPEWEMSDTEDAPAKSARPPAPPSPEWEMSDTKEPLNGILSTPWEDPLGSDSDEGDEEPAAKRAKV
jgi:hypothetical protein